MNSTVKSFLRQSVLSDVHLWIAFVAAAVFVLMEILDMLHWLPWKTPSNGPVIVIMIFILTMVADRLRERDQVQENAEKLGRLVESTLDKRVALRSRPSKPDEYAHLWGGYTGHYDAYNPSYQVDKATGEDGVVDIFLQRYRNPGFQRARYLFLTKDAPGQEDLKTFRRLMARVKREYPAVVGKVQVKVIENKEASSAAEMYLGTRDGKLTAVLELKDHVLGPTHGRPLYYLVINEEEVIQHYLQRHFDQAWDDDANAKAIDVFAEERLSDPQLQASPAAPGS